MHHFRYVGQRLHCESVDLAEVARLYGTPTYVYSAATIADNYTRLAKSLNGVDVQICYAMKANSTLAILRHFANLGAAFDLVSGGELRRVLAAGADVKRSVFAGVGKTEEEIALALQQGIFAFHVESEPEMARINHVAGKLGVKAPIAIRINPDVDAHTHAKITTGKSDNKFGIPLKVAGAAYEAASKYPNLRIKGVQMHIGSQLTDVAPFIEAVKKVAPFVAELKAKHGIDYFSIGGGIGIVYRDALASGSAEWWDAQPAGQRPITPEAYGAALVPLLKPLGLKILLEPGRYLVGNAGVLLSRVEYLKRGSIEELSHRRCSDERSGPSGHVRCLPRSGSAASRHDASRAGDGHRRADLRERRLFCQGPFACSRWAKASTSPSSAPAPTATPWPAATTRAPWPRRC
jgi:diaminopimelate decarboxylase